MEELQPQDIEDLLQELEEEYSAGEVPAPEVETKVRVCPECGKHNLENAWHCIDCGTTLSMKTLMAVEDGQPSMAPIGGQRALSSLSPHFEQDVAELLDTALQDDESVVWGCNITRIPSTPPFRFGYLLVTSRRLICVEFESEVEGREDQLLDCLLEVPLSLFTGYEVELGQQVRPKRPWIGATVPAVNYPSYPLTPKELASRRGAVYDLESLVSADLESAWFGDMLFVSLTARFHQDRTATFTFYAPHEAREARKLIFEHGEQPVQTTQTAQPTPISRLKGEMGFGERQQGSVTPEELSAPVHKEYQQQHPDLVASTERALQQVPATGETGRGRIDPTARSLIRCLVISPIAGLAVGLVIGRWEAEESLLGGWGLSCGAGFLFVAAVGAVVGAIVGAVAGGAVQERQDRIVGIVLGAILAGVVASLSWFPFMIWQIIELGGP